MPGLNHNLIQAIRLHLATKAEVDAATDKPAARGKGYSGSAGSQISGNLYRGSGGEFQAGPGGQLKQRLEAIRAARKGKKTKPKGKAKGKGKPTDSRTPQEIANQNRAEVAKQTGMGDLEGVIVRLGAGMDSEQEKEAHDQLIGKGLAKRNADGSVTLTPAGKAWRRAADKGDVDGANTALREAEAGVANRTAKDSERASKKEAREKERADKKAERERAKAGRAKKKEREDKEEADTKPTSKVEKGKKPSDDTVEDAEEDDKPTSEETASETAGQVGLDEDSVSALRSAADGDAADSPELRKAGFLDEEGGATSEGVDALNALERGDARGYRRAARKARVRLRQEKTKRKKEEDKAKQKADEKRRADEERGNLEAEDRRQTINREVGEEVARIDRAKRRNPDRGRGFIPPPRPATKATDPPSTGAMVAFFLPGDVAQQIARLPSATEPTENLHITLAFLGGINDVQLTRRKARLVAALGNWAATHTPLTGTINGVGRFFNVEADDTNAVYVSPDVPGLPELRQSLLTCLRRAGVYAADNHGFTPHATIAYVPKGDATPAIAFAPTPIALNTLTLAWGDERVSWTLGGAIKGVSSMSDLTPILEDLTAISDEFVEVKAGARHSAGDNQMLQEIAEAASDIRALAIELGAGDPDEEEEALDDEGADADVEAEIKAIYSDPLAYAQHECSDIAGACSALQAMAALMASELSEGHEGDEEGTIEKLAEGMRTLTEFIDSEISAITEAGEGSTKAIGKRKDINPKDGIASYGNITFADQKNKKYPIDTEEHIRAAWTYISQEKNAAKYEADEVTAIKKRIVAAWKKLIDKAGPPSTASATKGIEFVNLDDGEEIAVLPGYSVKTVGDTGLVNGYLVKYGGDGDLSEWRDVFSGHTDYGRHKKSDVWVHHRMLPGLGKRRLTNQADISLDDEGVFIKHLLDLRNSYEAKLYSLAQQGKLGWSSGTAPHLVERKALGDGRHEVSQWILGLDASYTPTPAGGLVVNATAMKSLFDEAGLDLLAAIYEEPEVKSTGDARQRAILLEIGLLELETVE